jgi:hypothetical protein
VAVLQSLEPFTIGSCVPDLTGVGGRTAMLHLCCERVYKLKSSFPVALLLALGLVTDYWFITDGLVVKSEKTSCSILVIKSNKYRPKENTEQTRVR